MNREHIRRAVLGGLLVAASIVIAAAPQVVSAATLTAPGCSATVGNDNTATLLRADDDCVLKFTSGSNTWTVPSGMSSVRVLVVGGGGAGGQNGGGGGGGGAVVHSAAFAVTSGASLNITVGAGGYAAGNSDWNSAGGDGGASSFASMSAAGGGGGGSRGSNPHALNGRAGASGGGGGGDTNTLGGAGSVGGAGGGGHQAGCDSTGGGGGGASGAAGTAGATRDAGDGGDGVSSDITGVATYYGGGGAGGGTCDNSSGQTWSGTPGQGGAGRASAAAVANTGGGGGGGGAVGWSLYGGTGGSGVVILAWPGLALPPSNSVAPTVSGTAEVPGVLTGSTGTWTQSPTSYSYRWKRATSVAGSYTDIPAATGVTYTLTDDDIDMFIKLEVTASNAAGSDVGLSVATTKVTSLPRAMAATLGSITATSDGFTLSITNLGLLGSYSISVATSSGTVTRSTAAVTVTGLAAGASATVSVTTSRSGYRDTTVTVNGTAIAPTTTTTSSLNSTSANDALATSGTGGVDSSPSSASLSSTGAVTTTTTTLAATRAQVAAVPTEVTPSTTTLPAVTTTTIPAPDAPSAAPGESGATVDGEAVETTLSRLDNSLVIAGGGINATVFGITSDGARIPLNADGSLQLNEGDSVAVDASGFDDGQDVEVWMFSTPTVLGALTADSAGRISGKFALPASIEGGNHRLVLRGPNSNGADVVVSVGLLFGEINSGFSVNRWVIIIPLALAIGAGLIIPTSVRRRRREAVSVG